MPVDVSHFGRKMKGVVSWDHSKEEQVEKEVSVKQSSAEPTRIKIFEGGYVQQIDHSQLTHLVSAVTSYSLQPHHKMSLEQTR